MIRAGRAPRLVGRGREVAELEAELKQASTGSARAVMLVAEPGVGKSRLAAELLVRNKRWVTVLSATAYPLGATTSFGLWAEALERHFATLDADSVRALCGGVLYDLAGLLRSVAALCDGPPEREPPRLRLLAALTAVLRNLCRSAPVLIVLDDLHLADASSWDALGYLVRNLGDSRLLVIGTARVPDLGANALASDTVLRLEQDGVLRRMPLAPLGRDQVGELAAATLGERVPPNALVSWLYDRSLGNPLFALGLLRSLIDEGADLSQPQLRRLPEELRERVTIRTAALDEESRGLLEMLATVGRRIDLRDLQHLTGKPLDELGRLLDAVMQQRLVIEDERERALSYEIAHPLIQETIYQGIGRARRRRIHGAVARALLAAGSVAAAASHFASSAEPGDGEAITTVLHALRQAEQRESHREAMALLEALLALIPNGDRRWLDVLDVMSVEAEWIVDHKGDSAALVGVEAMRQIQPLVDGSGDLIRRGVVQLRLATFLSFGSGDPAAAERAAREALALFERAADRPRVRVATNELGWVLGNRGDLDAQEELARAALAAAEDAGDKVVAAQALSSLAWTRLSRGRFADAETALRRSAALARGEGRLYRLTWSLSFLGLSLALEGRDEESSALLREARLGDPAYADTTLLEIESWCSWLGGRFASAVEACHESAARNAGAHANRRSWGRPPAIVSLLELGRIEEAGQFLTEATRSDQWSITQALLTWVRGRLADARGDEQRAVVELSNAMAALLEHDLLPYAAFPAVDLAEIAARRHDAATASGAAAALASIATRIDRAPVRGCAALAAAYAAMAAGEHGDASLTAAGAAELLARAGYAGLQARALELAGMAGVDTDRAAAVGALSAAAALHESGGAVVRRERTLDALSMLGQPGRRAAAFAGRDGLTSRERDVARLAASGATARQIAETLHIGERTVETHLGNVYAKLGVQSKLELARRAAEVPL